MQTQIITFSRIGYSLAELAIHVGLSRSTLHRTVARGELETIKRVRRRLSPSSRLKGFAEWLMPITARSGVNWRVGSSYASFVVISVQRAESSRQKHPADRSALALCLREHQQCLLMPSACAFRRGRGFMFRFPLLGDFPQI
jgi:hypothetical protein